MADQLGVAAFGAELGAAAGPPRPTTMSHQFLAPVDARHAVLGSVYDPAREATALGKAISGAVSGVEVLRLAVDITRLDQELRRDDERPPAEVLTAFLEAAASPHIA